jgi:hypothetical protein
MTTTPTALTPEDATRIGLDTEWEVSFWCAHFSVTPVELRMCVEQVGPRTEDVEARLRDAARQSFRMGGED